jgi:two-component system, chemotaxis family, protein-glutamate methylesterase/glutaminase
MSKIRVLVVDDSSFNRKVISEILQASEHIEVVGTAFDGEDAIRKILQHNPDVITLDLEMPRMDGFAVLRWLMVNRPIPVLVVSSRESNRSVFKALDLGAVDFVVKPSRTASPQLKFIEGELLSKILAIPQLKFDHIRQRVAQAPVIQTPVALPRGEGERTAEVVAVAASTGGPPAIQQLLMGLSPHLLSPIVIAQHMPPIFTRLFAERLAGLTKRVVKEAVDGEALFPRHTYIAPGGKQLRIVRSEASSPRVMVTDRRPEDRFAPSANLLLTSVAKVYGRATLALVLTGMGDDGKEGALAVKEAGGIVGAESEASAVIFGMPREVIKAGAAHHIADIAGLAEVINRYAVVDEAAVPDR